MDSSIQDRETLIKQIRLKNDPWDMVVIGGGASGLGAALESVSRGYSTLLLEQHDFAKGYGPQIPRWH